MRTSSYRRLLRRSSAADPSRATNDPVPCLTLPDDFSARDNLWGDELAAQEFRAADLERNSSRHRSPVRRNAPRQINDWKTKAPRGQRVLNGVSGARERDCASSAQGKLIAVSFENEIRSTAAIVSLNITTSPLAAITREQAVRLKLSQFVAANA